MKNVNIADLRPGAVLEKDVLGLNGRLLACKGTVLGDGHIRVFSMWGVTDVVVAGEDGPACREGSVEDCHLERAAALVEMFLPLGPSPAPPGEEMRRQSRAHLAARLAAGWVPADPAVLSRQMPETAPSPALDRLIENDKALCSLPDVYFQVQDALGDPTCTAARLADIISRDAAMSAKLLRLVNSPAFAGGRQIDTLSRGVLVLGAKEISQLALGITVMSKFSGSLVGPVSMVDFWTHSLVCGVFAGLMAVHAKRRDQERFFVAGVLHDIGRLVMLQLAPEQTARAIRLAFVSKRPLYQVEREVFGYDHCQVAGRLLALWRIPESLADLVSGHHPEESRPAAEAGLINMADALAIAMQYGSSGQYLGFGPAPGVWEALGLAEGTLHVLIAQMRRQLENIMPIFFGT